MIHSPSNPARHDGVYRVIRLKFRTWSGRLWLGLTLGSQGLCRVELATSRTCLPDRQTDAQPLDKFGVVSLVPRLEVEGNLSNPRTLQSVLTSRDNPDLSGLLSELVDCFHAYADGKPDAFAGVRVDLAPDLSGFRRQVLGCVCCIGFGQVKSYGEVARLVGCPNGARAVGGAVAANPVPIVIPCHRVIASTGKLGGFSAGIALPTGQAGLKAALLAHEGVRAGRS